MKNIIYSLFVVLFLVGCQCKTEKTAKTDVKQLKTEINQLLVDWHQAATDANAEVYFGTMDSLAVYIGTDATENWTKKEFMSFAKTYFDRGKAWDFKTLERNIYLNEHADMAWFDELLDTWMGTCRGSGVLAHKNGIWKIKHYVLSVEVPNDNINEVIQANRKNDSIFRANFRAK